jgi:hypothetical protein
MFYRLRPVVQTCIEAERFNGSLSSVESAGQVVRWPGVFQGRLRLRDDPHRQQARVHRRLRVPRRARVVRSHQGRGAQGQVRTAARTSRAIGCTQPKKNGHPASSSVGEVRADVQGVPVRKYGERQDHRVVLPRPPY